MKMSAEYRLVPETWPEVLEKNWLMPIEEMITTTITTVVLLMTCFLLGHAIFLSSPAMSLKKRFTLEKRDGFFAVFSLATVIPLPFLTSSLCGACVYGRTCNIFSFQVCPDRSFYFSWLCSCVVCTQCMPTLF